MRVPDNHPLALPALEAVIGQLDRQLSTPLVKEHLNFSLDQGSSELVIQAKDFTRNGDVGIYKGSTRYPYGKADLLKVLPYPLVYTGPYPTIFRNLAQWMKATYGILMEEGEFATTNRPTTPLVGNAPVDAEPETSVGVVSLVALASSGRWQAGSTIRLLVTGSGGAEQLNGLISMRRTAELSQLVDSLEQSYYPA